MCNLNLNNMKRTTLILLSLLLLNLMGLYAQKYDVSVQKIWDNGSHTAFTSLIDKPSASIDPMLIVMC